MKLRRPVVFVGCIDTPARRRQLATGTIENSVGSTDGLRLRIDAVSVRMKHVEVCSTSCLRIHGLLRISLKSYGKSTAAKVPLPLSPSHQVQRIWP
jgi:hypothetical protein